MSKESRCISLKNGAVRQTFGFREFTQLRHLHLGPFFDLLDRHSEFHGNLSWITHTVTFPALVRLTLELEGERFDMLTELPAPWTPVDSCLSAKVSAPGTSSPYFSLRVCVPPSSLHAYLTQIRERAVDVLTINSPAYTPSVRLTSSSTR
ncbi:hypothetical protein B0H19DRAFT_1259699 [Mycena capillaripes]|nr:hypothetical protein B0H19DRAFT_1259699 [Mycena capillaripes]